MDTYEKKYEELVGKIEKAYLYAQTDSTKAVLEEIRPELAESEDKRIRKAIIDFFSEPGRKEYILKGFTVDDILVWLEKQGTPYTKRDIDDAYLKGISDTKNEIEKQYEATYQIRKDIATFIFNYRGDIKDRAKWMNYLGIKVSLVEKQGEQKDFAPKSQRMVSSEATEATYTTEVETGDGGIKALVTGKVVMPKFKVVDWAVSNLDEKTRQISEVHFDEYNSYYVVDGKSVNLEEYDRLHHLWTIADAKDGDVLQLGAVTAIFKEYIGNGNCMCYCSVCSGEFEIPSQDGADNSYGCHNATPATKEQRDTLIKAMTDAGYTFDFEKKELKKIEQTPTWSQEDEKNWRGVIDEIKANKSEAPDYDIKTYDRYLSWLKSLKERYTWKPSDEQMKALHDLNLTGNISYAGQGQTLIELYNDLKKLREE